MKMRLSTVSVCTATVAVVVSAGTALAAPLTITADTAASSSATGSTFSGTIDYTGAGSTGLLTLTLTNNTAPAIGGYLTGIAFNVASTDNAIALTLSTKPNSSWSGIANANASPFGTLDFGTALGGNWTGGGSPSAGIAPGATGVFTFAVAAGDAGSLTPSSFLSGGSGVNFAVRFRGLSNGGSDKVPGVTVPAPGLAGLLGIAGFGAVRRRR